MRTLLTIAAVWVALDIAVIALRLRATRHKVADLVPHCRTCADVDETLARLDFSLWAIECEAAL